MYVRPSKVQANKGGEVTHFVIQIRYTASIDPNGNLIPRAFPFLSSGKGPGTGRSHDFQHPDIVGVINYNNNELENPRWPPT